MEETIKRDSPVERAARLMNKSAQFVREGLKRGILPIGNAIQGPNGRWSYYISPKLFKDYTGKDLEEVD